MTTRLKAIGMLRNFDDRNVINIVFDRVPSDDEFRAINDLFSRLEFDGLSIYGRGETEPSATVNPKTTLTIRYN